MTTLRREEPSWRKSSRSAGHGQCVEVRGGQVIQVRDSKDPSGPVLRFTAAEWAVFVARVKRSA